MPVAKATVIDAVVELRPTTVPWNPSPSSEIYSVSPVPQGVDEFAETVRQLLERKRGGHVPATVRVVHRFSVDVLEWGRPLVHYATPVIHYVFKGVGVGGEYVIAEGDIPYHASGAGGVRDTTGQYRLPPLGLTAHYASVSLSYCDYARVRVRLEVAVEWGW